MTDQMYLYIRLPWSLLLLTLAWTATLLALGLQYIYNMLLWFCNNSVGDRQQDIVTSLLLIVRTGRPLKVHLSYLSWLRQISVEICYRYLNRIVPKSGHVLADSSTNNIYCRILAEDISERQIMVEERTSDSVHTIIIKLVWLTRYIIYGSSWIAGWESYPGPYSQPGVSLQYLKATERLYKAVNRYISLGSMYTAAFKPYKSRIPLRSRYFEQAENSVLVIHWSILHQITSFSKRSLRVHLGVWWPKRPVGYRVSAIVSRNVRLAYNNSIDGVRNTCKAAA